MFPLPAYCADIRTTVGHSCGTLSNTAANVDGDTAVTSGMGSLTFVVTTNGVDGTQRSWHVNVLRRQRDGSWLIWKRMRGDLR